MIERGGRLRFLDKATHPVLVRSEFAWQYLQSDRAIQPCIVRSIHFAHPAGSQT
jgi:hypothetical protein